MSIVLDIAEERFAKEVEQERQRWLELVKDFYCCGSLLSTVSFNRQKAFCCRFCSRSWQEIPNVRLVE